MEFRDCWDFVRCVAIFAHDVRKRRIRAMDGEYAPVADGDCNADKIRTAS